MWNGVPAPANVTPLRLSVAAVAVELGVSESTVRRDFMEMERAQLARRTHGGIVAVDVAYSLATVPRSADEGSAQRERVADRAAAMVESGVPAPARSTSSSGS